MFVRALVAVVCAALAACNEPTVASDEATIRAAADHVAARDTSIGVRHIAGGRARIDYVDLIAYADGSELMRENPNCCFIGVEPRDTPTPTCLFRSFDVVTVRCKARYRDDAGVVQEQPVTRRVAVDRFGVVCPTD